MIDDKKIEEISENIFSEEFELYGVDVDNPNGKNESLFTDDQIKRAIKLGAKWAIQEFLKSLWHDVKEEPRNDYSDILVIRKEPCHPETLSPQLMLEDIEDENMSYKDYWLKVCNELHITQYCYIDDLLPKQKGNKQ